MTEKVEWEGEVISVQPRIRLNRSFDERNHGYLGYSIQVDGTIAGVRKTFWLGIGKAAQGKHQFQFGVGAEGYCQVNEIETAQPIDGYIPLLSGHNLGARHRLPFTECPRAKLAIVNRSRQMPTQPEQIAYHAINRKKALCLSS